MTAVALRRPPPDARQMQRCLLLALLLHVWLVLMFGNATGTAAPGQGVWGSLTVKLLGRSGGDADAPPADTATGGAGPSPAEAGARALGRPRPQPVPPEAARTDDAADAPPSTATLDLPEGFRPVERQDLGTPPPAAPLQLPAPELPSATLNRLETRPDAAVTPLAPAASLRTPARAAQLPIQPADLPAPVNRLDAAPAGPATATLPRPAELRAAPAATAAVPSADLPRPVTRLEAPAAAATTAVLPRPAELRSTATATPALTPPTALPAPVQRLEAATTDGAAVAPLARASDLRAPGTVAAATAAALQGAQDLPAPVRRLESTDAAGGVAPLAATPNTRAAVPAPGATSLSELAGNLPGQVSAPAGPARGDPNASPFAAPKAAAGSPDAGPRLGPDVPAPPPSPTAAASAPRAPLNLALPRGDMTARRGSTGLIALIPPPPERKSKLEQSVEDAVNKDCRKAYSGAGLLAVVPLAIDAARGKGCKW
ncbi:hypothetical protein ACG04Q_06435 [Roseateles sp. DXS20W]|uniref:Meckel syndrome type 1 protein n=1 Tax=Pelomonas lactea TaxID=3299030 RepID=A0ABW7GGZ4_9BURK